MPEATVSGADFKKQLREGSPKMGLFLNAHSPTVAEQLAHSGYDWLLVDTQHGPMGYEKLSAMLAGISNGGAKSLVRVGGYRRSPRNSASSRHGRRRRSGPLHQHRRRSTPGRELHQVSHGRHALGLFPAAQHEQGRPAGLCRQLQQQRHRRAAGGNRFLH